MDNSNTGNEKVDFGKQVAENITFFMNSNNQNQKEFAKMMDISESTLSGYLNGNLKITGPLSFLIRLKKHFPDYSIDQILFNKLSEEPNHKFDGSIVAYSSDLYKFYGAYYLYYFDTSKNDKLQNPYSLDNMKTPPYSLPELRYGILYICKPSSDEASQTKCIAAIGIKAEEDAKEISEKISLLDEYKSIYNFLLTNYHNKLYTGIFNMSQQNLFINLNRYQGRRDCALIVMRHADFNRNSYKGGIGTINSVSSGTSSDPVVQLIALSRTPADYIGLEQIKSQLWFSTPNTNISALPEAQELLGFIRNAYMLNTEEIDTANAFSQLSAKNKEILITSYLCSLVEDVLRRNVMCFGRVSLDSDDSWYRLLKDSESFRSGESEDD